MISVIIPTHNRSALLDEALSHVYAQTNCKLEVIVVNDIENDDATQQVVAKYKDIVYIEDATIQGPSNKHIAAMKLAHGDYLYMPDDDDYLTRKSYLSEAEQILNSNSNIAFVAANVDILNAIDGSIESGRKLRINGLQKGESYLQTFQEEKPMSVVTAVFRKAIFDKMPERYMLDLSDTCLYLYALLYGDAYIVEESVAAYRVGQQSVTRQCPRQNIMRGLKQKEIIYKLAREKYGMSNRFWNNQFKMTYSFYTQSNPLRWNLIYVLGWGIIHSHGSLALLHFCSKKIIRQIISIR